MFNWGAWPWFAQIIGLIVVVIVLVFVFNSVVLPLLHMIT